MTKQDILDILVRRDSMSHDEASQLIQDVQDQIWLTLDDELISPDECVIRCGNIVREELGLEVDYVDSFLF